MARLGRGQAFGPIQFGAIAAVAVDVTVALTGQSITAGQGSVVFGHANALTGLAATSGQGSVTRALSKALTGQSGTLSSGSVTSARSVGFTGQAITAAQGTVSAGNDVTVSITGQSITVSLGALTPARSIGLGGQAITVGQGTLAPAGSTVLALTGQAITLGLGGLTSAASVVLTGASITSSAGLLSYAASDYPSVAASRSIRLPAGGVWVIDPDVTDWCEVIWNDVLPDGVTLAGVAYTLPAALTLVDEKVDTAFGKSALKVSGATHASMNQIAAVATLSNGATIPFTAPLRCFNG